MNLSADIVGYCYNLVRLIILNRMHLLKRPSWFLLCGGSAAATLSWISKRSDVKCDANSEINANLTKVGLQEREVFVKSLSPFSLHVMVDPEDVVLGVP